MRLVAFSPVPLLAIVAVVGMPTPACGTRCSGPIGTIAVTGGSLNATRQLVLISPASRKTARVTAPDDIVRYDLSPDGRRIVVTGLTGMWVMRRDGLHARRIFSGGGEVA